ncbi:MAG: hypothetical protein KatS3mg015_1512 [Fimbriimonadales bacterium]|nr:MAG: hypothetical protein KatS3mg015_1512 [Fimbriimonadales bacterium]
MSRRGLTLIELLSVLTIVAVLAALLYPVFKSVRMRALDAECASKLRQYGQALAIYRHEYGGDGVYGHPYAMGLPPSPFLPGLPRSLYYCPLGQHGRTSFIPVASMGDPVDEWMALVQRWRDDTLVQADLNHNRSGAAIRSPYMVQRGIGLYLGGHVRIVEKAGDPARPEFWYEKE